MFLFDVSLLEPERLMSGRVTKLVPLPLSAFQFFSPWFKKRAGDVWPKGDRAFCMKMQMGFIQSHQIPGNPKHYLLFSQGHQKSRMQDMKGTMIKGPNSLIELGAWGQRLGKWKL